ncbi:MAG: 4'-phosphopantetheinyl transferase superfamily protein [Gammaproteobacteria bacterium]
MTQSTTTPSPVIPDDLAERLFDNQATVVVQPIADFRHCLYQSELELVQDVSDKRMLEFSTGRDCAHQALHKMGYETCPILKGEQREPIWPEGVVGSISHCRDLAGAVMADKARIRSVGFDIENLKQLNPDISRHVCTPEEKIWIKQLPVEQQNLGLLLIFSLKEAVFKCVYQATGQSLGFKQCRVVMDDQFDQANVTLAVTGNTALSSEVCVQHYLSNSHVYTCAYLHYLPAVG